MRSVTCGGKCFLNLNSSTESTNILWCVIWDLSGNYFLVPKQMSRGFTVMSAMLANSSRNWTFIIRALVLLSWLVVMGWMVRPVQKSCRTALFSMASRGQVVNSKRIRPAAPSLWDHSKHFYNEFMLHRELLSKSCTLENTLWLYIKDGCSFLEKYVYYIKHGQKRW